MSDEQENPCKHSALRVCDNCHIDRLIRRRAELWEGNEALRKKVADAEKRHAKERDRLLRLTRLAVENKEAVYKKLSEVEARESRYKKALEEIYYSDDNCHHETIAGKALKPQMKGKTTDPNAVTHPSGWFACPKCGANVVRGQPCPVCAL